MILFYILYEFFHNFFNLCIILHLQPKLFIYKTVHKKRKFRKIKNKQLNYGHAGLMFLAPLTLTSKHLFRLSLLIKKATRRTDRTFRYY